MKWVGPKLNRLKAIQLYEIKASLGYKGVLFAEDTSWEFIAGNWF